MQPCLPPVPIARVFEDPTVVRRLVERHAPYWPVQRYFDGAAQYRALAGGGDPAAPMIVAPNFRGDWAEGVPLVEGAEAFLAHPGFARAARELFDAAVVRPHLVYVNLTWQLPFDQGAGHTDVPAFRGVDRTDTPIWLLTAMGHSGLFEAERIRIATAVAWFYEGSDGGFCYWPDGPDAPPKVHEGDIFNTAFVGDNDRMFHRVRPVGRRADGLPGPLSLDSRLEHRGGDAWAIAEGDRTVASFPFRELRISVSWKAMVFASEDERRRVDAHEDDLDLDAVLDRVVDDFARRGEVLARPADPLRDPEFVERIAGAYMRTPSVFDRAA